MIVSIDFIKSDRRRNDFIRACPELVIVDEAHTCARSEERASSGRHQRHALVRDLASQTDRHLILVTATPHSGKDAAFRSLLGLLDSEFAELPEDLAGEVNRRHRERLARHLVQRRRSEIRDFLGADTRFPERAETEVGYELSSDYRTLFDQVLSYARGSLSEHEHGSRQQRIRKWSALGLLRALASSPAAAAATLRTRAFTADADGYDDIDERGRRLILDLDDAEEAPDVVPGSRLDQPNAESAVSRRLRQFAKQADEIASASTSKGTDAKLDRLIEILGRLLADGYRPIVFCRFIDTAEYVAERLATRLPKKGRPQIAAVTGRLPPAEREARIAELGEHPRRLLVCTDCLSEGINLQDHFSAVVHYDLPWNPTRLEQREGRVDRYGQCEPEVRVVTCWGTDNRIDETVLEVLLRKHRTIRSTLGISIPVPGSTNEVVEALAEQVLESAGQALQMPLEGIIEQLRPQTDALDAEWDRSASNEQRRRSLFAQSRIDPQEVHAQLLKMQEAIGSGADSERFVLAALEAYGAAVARRGTPEAASYDINLSEVSRSLRDAVVAPSVHRAASGDADRLSIGFSTSVSDGAVRLSRTHPTVGGLAAYVLDRALDSAEADGLDIDARNAGHANGDQPPRRHPPVAARCGVMRTDAVSLITTLLLCRVRMSITVSARGGDHHMLAEEAVLLAFVGSSNSPQWLTPDETLSLLAAEPVGNIAPPAASERIARILKDEASWRPTVHAEADSRATALADAHRGVREADRRPGSAPRAVAVRAQLPVDVLAIYHFLPEARTS